MNARRLTILAAVLMAMIWAHPRALEAAGTQGAQDSAALKEEIAAKVSQWTAQQADPSQNEAAIKATHAIAESICQSLQSQLENPDLEVRLRVRELSEGLLEVARFKKCLSILPPARRKTLIAFYTQSRPRFNAIFQPPQMMMMMYGGVSAFSQIIPMDDLRREHEPILVVSLRFGGQGTAREVATLVSNSEFRSPEMIDALLQAVVMPVYRDITPESGRANIFYGQPMNDPWPVCLSALQSLGNRQHASLLLAAMLKKKELSIDSYLVDSVLAQTVAAMGSKSLLPPLMEQLEKTLAQQPQSMPYAGVDAGIRSCDSMIHCATLLAGLGQPMMRVNLPRGGVVDCFKNEQDRQDAIARLKEWWDKNKASIAASQPVVLPDLDDWARRSRSASPSTAASTQKAKRFDPAEGKALADKLQQACQAMVKDLGHDRVSRRQAADRFFRETFVAYLDALLDAGDHLDTAVSAGELMEKAVVESQFEALLASQSPAFREKMIQCRKAIPETFDQVLSMDRVSSSVGIRSLAKLGADKQAMAEPLLVYCLRHPSNDVMMAALDVAASGVYKSDEIVCALSDTFCSPFVYFNWYQVLMQGTNKIPAPMAMKALIAIRTPLAVSTLVSSVSNNQNNDMYRMLAICSAIAECNDKSAVPALVALLDRKSMGSMGFGMPNGKQMTMCDRDGALMALVKITGQDPADYKFTLYDMPTGMAKVQMYGFTDEQARTAAITKFQQWWKDNKDKPPYSELKPLPLPPKLPPARIPTYGPNGVIY